MVMTASTSSQVFINEYTGAENQWWKIVKRTGGVFTIQSKMGGNTYVNANSSGASGTNIILGSYTDNQWKEDEWNLNQCTGVEENFTQAVFVGVHSAFLDISDLINPFYHASIIITVSIDSELFLNTYEFLDYKTLGSSNLKYFSIGGESNMSFPLIDCLIGLYNRPTDVSFDNKDTLIDLGIYEMYMIEKIIELHENYVSKTPYLPYYGVVPTETNGVYNSNSYAHGLLKALEYSYEFELPIPNLTEMIFGILPGWEIPVPTIFYL